MSAGFNLWLEFSNRHLENFFSVNYPEGPQLPVTYVTERFTQSSTEQQKEEEPLTPQLHLSQLYIGSNPKLGKANHSFGARTLAFNLIAIYYVQYWPSIRTKITGTGKLTTSQGKWRRLRTRL